MTSDDTITALRTWLEDGGAHIGPVRIASDATLPSHRRLEATALLPDGTSFLRVPPSHLISASRARTVSHIITIQTKAARCGLANKLPASAEDSAYLLLFLLSELCKGTASFWRTWFNSLPLTLATPLTAPSDDVSRHLAGTPVLPLVQMLRRELRDLYNEWFVPLGVNAHPKVYPRALCTFERFVYARAIIESRAFRIGEEVILAPFADMANHAGRGTDGCNAGIRVWETRDKMSGDGVGLEMYVEGIGDGRAIETSEELRISYGPLANWQLLLHFGFVPEGGRNPFDGVLFELDDDEMESDGDESERESTEDGRRRMIIMRVVCSGEDCVFMLREDDPLPKELVRFARVMLLEGVEMNAGIKRDYDVMVSERNERAVVERLRAVLDALVCDIELVAENEGKGKEDREMKQLWKYCRVYMESVLRMAQQAHQRIDMLEKAIACGE